MSMLSIKIGATLDGSFNSAMTGSTAKLSKLGDSIKQLDSSMKSVSKFKQLNHDALEAMKNWKEAETGCCFNTCTIYDLSFDSYKAISPKWIRQSFNNLFTFSCIPFSIHSNSLLKASKNILHPYIFLAYSTHIKTISRVFYVRALLCCYYFYQNGRTVAHWQWIRLRM